MSGPGVQNAKSPFRGVLTLPLSPSEENPDRRYRKEEKVSLIKQEAGALDGVRRLCE